MIQASELRIGNYVFDDEGILSKINGMQPYGYSIRCDEEEGCELLIDLYPQDGTIKKGFEVDINLCNPIPLTEEWLLKFGFEITKQTKEDNNIWTFKGSECKFELEQIIKFHLYDNMYFGTEVKHVHQLQNLYFALTGEELKLNKN